MTNIAHATGRFKLDNPGPAPVPPAAADSASPPRLSPNIMIALKLGCVLGLLLMARALYASRVADSKPDEDAATPCIDAGPPPHHQLAPENRTNHHDPLFTPLHQVVQAMRATDTSVERYVGKI